MSSSCSDFEDCSEDLNVPHNKKKSKRMKVITGKCKNKLTLKNPNNVIRKKKQNTKVREFERNNKSNQIEQVDSKNVSNESNKVIDDVSVLKKNAELLTLNVHNNSNENVLTSPNKLPCEINRTLKDGASDSDNSDKNERIKYIKLLSKLIDLNMPSKIESNRSNEAYTKRQSFLEKRRYNVDKIECYPLFYSDCFWLELQHRVKSRTDDRIKRMKEKTLSILKELMQFKVVSDDGNVYEVPKEKIYAISKSYLTKIKQAHDQVSEILGKYHYYLSFWPTTAKMKESIIHENSIYVDYYLQINENIETIQAWQNCCQWLNWKTRQICQLVGISGKSLNDFIIVGYHNNTCCYSNEHSNGIEFNFEENNIFHTDCDIICELRNQFSDKSRLRSHSLNLALDFNNSTNLVTSDSSVENLEDSDYESKFEIYADINRRRYGMEKVCSAAISTVSEMLDKYKNLFSITKDENTLPLMHSYAEAVKDGVNWPNSLNGKQLIFTENLSEESCSSYQTAKPVFDDNLEFPTIQSMRPSIINIYPSPSISSNPSMSHFNQEDILDVPDETIPISLDLIRRMGCDSLNYQLESPVKFQESKGLFGLKNQVAARLCLPPLLPHYIFLARFPIKLMHCCIKKILSSSDISKISELSVLTIKQRIIDYKDALQYTTKARKFLFDYTFGINFQINKYLPSNSKEFAPKQDVDLSDFMSSSMKEIDADLSSLLRHYIECLKELLKKWSKSSSSCKYEHGEPRKLLEEEWNFVKTYCHNIKQEEEIVASSFCNLAEYLFDLLQSRIECDHKIIIDVDNSPSDSPSLSNAEDDMLSTSSINNRRMSKSCQTYNNKCKMIQSQLKQAADFAKMLRSDLEISIQLELNINYSMNELLSFLSLTKHKMIDLCSLDEQPAINQIDLTLIIPEESSSFIKELLDPLITGFSIQSKDDILRTNLLNSPSSKSQCAMSREYILIINKKSKINWPGEKLKFIYQLDIGNLQQRIESSNIVFLARRPDKLMEQLSLLLEFRIQSKNIQFKNVIQSCSEGQVEACHYNSKRTLNALKSKAIEVGQVLHNLFIYEEKDAFTGSELNKIQEETLRNSIKNSYSIIFDFYRDLIKLCTGDAFKTTLKNTITGLLEKWFKFSRKFEPSERGTVPRWANDGLNFLLQLCQSRVVMTMTKKEWQDFKKSIDNFVEFIVGKSNRQNSNTSGRSTTNSSKIITGRSWLMTPKPDIIHGCENNATNSKKIENWDTNCDNRTLRSAFSEPSHMVNSDQHIFISGRDHHIDTKTAGHFTEITFARSLTVNDQCPEHSRDAPNSNKSTDGSSNEDHKDRKRITLKQAIVELEKQLNEKRRQNNLMGFVRDSNSDHTSSCYIKKAPFQWIKKGLIGQGHAGTVYKVCNLDTMEIMAMKEIVINEPFSQDLIECDLLCKLNHTSLLKYYGVDISLSHVRIFTEYCESGSLSQISILDIPEINLRQWTKQILEAIMHLHNHKIVHRDVKPDNIFLKNIQDTNECHAKLGDFGVAKYLSHQDGLKDIKGTVMYMAPEVVVVDSEQNKSKPGYNHKVDIWSLGCMVLYMITGKPPWDENHQLAIYYNLGNKKLPQIPDVDSSHRMTKEARDFICACLKINPDDRLEALDLMNYNFVKLRNH